MQHGVIVFVGRGVAAYPQVAEQFVEAVLHVHVVVGLEHTQHQRLAEAARPHQEEVAAGKLQSGNEHGLVHIVEIL